MDTIINMMKNNKNNESSENTGIIQKKKKKKIIPKSNQTNINNSLKQKNNKNQLNQTITNNTLKQNLKNNMTKVNETIIEEPIGDEVALTEKINQNLNNSPIEPLFWVLPNKKSFPQWVSETFIKYRADGKPPKSTPGVKKAFKYQKLLRDYMQNKSPYRGVLLYHTLGAGKTMSSIIIAENLKTEKNIVVMLPASLKPNFEKEISSLPIYKNNPEAWKEKYSFVITLPIL